MRFTSFLLFLLVSSTLHATTFSLTPPSRVEFTVKTVVLGGVGRTDVLGINQKVTGDINIQTGPKAVSVTAEIRIATAAFDTGIGARDEHVRQVLKHSSHPEILFQLTRTDGLEPKVWDAGAGTVTAYGNLTVAGVAKPVEFPVYFQRKKDTLILKGSVNVKFSDFNLKPPSFGYGLNQAKEEMTLRGMFTATQKGSPGGKSMLPDSLSQSKLGPHLLTDAGDAAAKILLAARPRLAKWVLPIKGALPSLKNYKLQCPQGTAILRVWWPVKVKYDLAWKPSDAAEDYWQHMVQGGLPLPAMPEVDWLEGANEFDNFPSDRWYDEDKASRWFAAFWSVLADTMNAHGYHPMVGSFVAGQPKPGTLKRLAAVMKTKKYRWSWGYHSYTLTMTRDLKKEMEYAFYFRTLREACGLQGIPLILSEGGFLDPSVNKGWKASHTAKDYLDWLRWFDAEIQKDKDVVGLTIFQSGNRKDFASFDLEPLARDLALVNQPSR